MPGNSLYAELKMLSKTLIVPRDYIGERMIFI
jgi:hypothetical protein